jgi:hypothetical protein
MNKRVKELMLEAGFAAPELAGRANLLAELIARDICKIVKGQKIAEPLGGYQDWENGYNASVKHAVAQIKRQYKVLNR